MSILIRSITDAGAAGTGAADDRDALQSALDEIGRHGKGTLLFEEPPNEYLIKGSLIIPKVDITILGRGFHTSIRGQSLDADEPVLTWIDRPGHVDHGFFLQNLTVRRNTAGPVIRFTQNSASTGGSGDRWQGTIQNVQLIQPNDGDGTLLYLEGVLNCRIDNILLRGGSKDGIGLHIKSGSNAYVTGVTVMYKRAAPNALLIENGGEHHFSKMRAEGGSGEFSYKFVNVRGSIFESLKSEGDAQRYIFIIENCEDLMFISPGIGTSSPTAVDPNGMVFNNARRCTVVRARGGSLSSVGSGTGRCFVVGADCEDITIDAFVQSNVLQEIDDQGGKNIAYDIQDGARRIMSCGITKSRKI